MALYTVIPNIFSIFPRVLRFNPGNVFVRKLPHGKGFQLVLLDNGLYRSYNDEFRLDYSNLWLALLRRDEEGIKKYAMKIGSTDMYQLFASMLTTRSWEQYDGHYFTSTYTKLRIGVAQSSAAASDDELDEIRINAMNYAPEITQILSQVPSELLLLFKTKYVCGCQSDVIVVIY